MCFYAHMHTFDMWYFWNAELIGSLSHDQSLFFFIDPNWFASPRSNNIFEKSVCWLIFIDFSACKGYPLYFPQNNGANRIVSLDSLAELRSEPKKLDQLQGFVHWVSWVLRFCEGVRSIMTRCNCGVNIFVSSLYYQLEGIDLLAWVFGWRPI